MFTMRRTCDKLFVDMSKLWNDVPKYL